MKIGELADAAGVNVQTIRYYERRGILFEPARTASGYRQYDAGTAARIRFVRRAQSLGFTLGEIGELLALRVGHEDVCADVEARTRVKLENVDGKIRELVRLRGALAELADSCARRATTGECPILEALDEGKWRSTR